AKRLSKLEEVIILCGHYEGVDERVVENLIDEEISLGDFILTGGEIPALAIIDSTARYIEGVLGNANSTEEESFNMGLLEHPQYTRPANFRGMEVPPVLLSGNHKEIQKWCREQSLTLTWRLRPDLLSKAELTKADLEYLNQLEEYCPEDNSML
ncbi:MAG: tRNA (guanosine(37)-N1)-methyltransferase TrmD, partial [Clostridiales bacterium]|nr:tRNA (guanosine(37)-N1)-methyltransferase TrmD [Clostridiales bacterium]